MYLKIFPSLTGSAGGFFFAEANNKKQCGDETPHCFFVSGNYRGIPRMEEAIQPT